MAPLRIISRGRRLYSFARPNSEILLRALGACAADATAGFMQARVVAAADSNAMGPEGEKNTGLKNSPLDVALAILAVPFRWFMAVAGWSPIPDARSSVRGKVVLREALTTAPAGTALIVLPDRAAACPKSGAV